MSNSRSKTRKRSRNHTRLRELSRSRLVGNFKNMSVRPFWTVFMTTKLMRYTVVIAGLFMMGGSILAHHGTGTYDSTKSVTLSGTVTEFAFTNPHAALYFDVKDETGKTVNWAIEMNSPGVLARAGWSKKMFKYGDQITITV